ncbi:uncharacterized protein PHACADRAFT_248670 [Phanerochaete carnosa HHB-10118-sp]|uniref:Large ribosomal subunit protein uL2m n=1 Tax=Phanerochaete carnosa (strain HHB-10118-sp) TaxID=650164 RepID=K5VFM6_PHACS|nr:uncharacterized protein PHACADRAFT_248670 [Phanerochaete carnosa HHB-10118-sp]EKM61796.1 hypothetical protein PHACADRAFT_248670 [Phanerochaete carnosa HHB-10118-sp]
MFSARWGVSLLRSCVSSLKASPLKAPSTSTLPRLHPFNRTLATEVISNAPTEVNQAFRRSKDLYKTYKPITPSIRHLKRPLSPHLYQGRPLRQLTVALRKKGGRNGHGRITIRFRGGGHKRRIRLVDFMRTEPGPHDVVRIEYDPGRSAHIALIKSRNSRSKQPWSYILSPEGLRAGDVVESFRQGIPDGYIPGFTDSKSLRGKDLEAGSASEGAGSSSVSLALGVLRTMTLKNGNALPLRLLPTGTIIHNIALDPEGRAILVRSAGTFAQVVTHEDGGKYTHVRLQSGEIRKVLQDCVATIGRVSNPLWMNRNLAKAGRSRWLGRRPRVRGMAMNR